MNQNKDKKVVVMGGGPAGLTAAYELCKSETDVVVLEKGNIRQVVSFYDTTETLLPVVKAVPTLVVKKTKQVKVPQRTKPVAAKKVVIRSVADELQAGGQSAQKIVLLAEAEVYSEAKGESFRLLATLSEIQTRTKDSLQPSSSQELQTAIQQLRGIISLLGQESLKRADKASLNENVRVMIECVYRTVGDIKTQLDHE